MTGGKGMFLIQDHQRIYEKVQEPYAVLSKSCGTLLRIGEKENMERYFNHITNRYMLSGLREESEDIVLMELPKDQLEIDKVVGIVDYVGKLYQASIKQA